MSSQHPDDRFDPPTQQGAVRHPGAATRRAIAAMIGRLRVARGRARALSGEIDRELIADAAHPLPPTVIAEWRAKGEPHLASRVRRDLERVGLVIEELSIGQTGTHTVVAVRVPLAARPVIERLAAESGFPVTFHEPDTSTADPS